MGKEASKKGKNRLLFTEAWLKKVSPDKVATYSDVGCKGLLLRVAKPRKGHTAKSRRKFIFKRHVAGSPVETTIGSHSDVTLDKAREVCTRLRAQDKQIDVSATVNTWSKTGALTVGEAIDDYWEQHCEAKLSSRTLETYKSQLRHFNYLRDLPAEQVTFAVVDKLVAKLYAHRKANGKPYAQSSVGLVYKFFERAMEHAKRKTKKLSRDFPMPFDEKGILGSLVQAETLYSWPEFWRLWQWSPAYWRNAKRLRRGSSMTANGYLWKQRYKEEQRCIRLLMLTACRAKEIASLTWGEFKVNGAMNMRTGDMEPALILSAKRTKKRKPFVVPLHSTALNIISAQYKEFGPFKPSDRLFPSIPHKTNYLWHITKKRGGFTNHIHDIRRTVATMYAACGGSESLVDSLLSHGRKTAGKAYNKYQYFTEKFELTKFYNQMLIAALARGVEHDADNRFEAECEDEIKNVISECNKYNKSKRISQRAHLTLPSEGGGEIGF